MPKIIVPYRVSGLSTVYLVMERLLDNYLLADLAGAFSASPADFPGFTESTKRPQDYEAEITTLNDGLYQISAYVRQGAAKDRQVDLHIWSQRKRYLNNVDIDDALLVAIYNLLLAGTTIPQTAHVFTAGEKIVVARGDQFSMAFALGAAFDCTGKRLFFAVKNSQTAAVVINVECTLTDAANVVGTVPLTSALLATVFSGTYEYERRDADGTSNPYTIVQGPFLCAQDVRQ